MIPIIQPKTRSMSPSCQMRSGRNNGQRPHRVHETACKPLAKKEAPSWDGASAVAFSGLGGQLEERRLLVEVSDSDSVPRRVPAEPLLPAAVLAPVEAEPPVAP